MSAHGTDSAYGQGCRCDACREAHRVYAADLNRRRLSWPVPERAHGTEGGYTNWGCRCDRCRDAQRRAVADARAARASRGLPDGDPRHGTTGGYNNWGCRCAECRAAHAADAIARYRARRAS